MDLPPNLVLDLHGRRLDDAIKEVTLFLERIRRGNRIPHHAASSGSSERRSPLCVKIITGSGSHSSHGPVLRSAVQTLFQKRGMSFALERGGGAFLVDALSGWDLYSPGVATDSKVVLTEQEQFYLLAKERMQPSSAITSVRRDMGPAVAHALGPPTGKYARNNTDPLPSQAASEEEDLREAMRISQSESQKHRNHLEYMEREDYNRALCESQAEHAAYSQTKLKQEIALRRALSLSNKIGLDEELSDHDLNQGGLSGKSFESDSLGGGEQSLMKMVARRSVAEEEQRQQQLQLQYEKEIELAVEESTKMVFKENVEYEIAKEEEERLLQEILAKSLEEIKSERSSEEQLLQKVMAESLLEGKKPKYDDDEDEQLQSILAQSEKEAAAASGEDIVEKVKRLSLQEQEIEAMEEEEKIKKAIELSMRQYTRYQDG